MMRFRLFLFGVLVLAGCDKPQPAGNIPADTTRRAEGPGALPPEDDRDSARTALPDTLLERETVDSLEPPGSHTTILPAEPEPDPVPIEPERTDGSGDLAGSCDVRSTEQFCFAYTGDGWSPGAAQEHCGQAPDSEYGSNACPTEGRIATCIFQRDEDPAQEITYTYYEPVDPALAEIACPGEFQLEE